MTRAFFKILSFDLIGAFSYNILSIPLFVFLIVLFIIVLYDIIKDKKALEEKGIKFLEKYYILIIILLIISMIVNIYRGI